MNQTEELIRASRRPTAEERIKLGAMLHILKASVRHGEFRDRLAALGIAVATAGRAMQAATRFGTPAAKRLVRAAATSSKLFELLALSDSEVETLLRGDEARGLTLGRIKTMSVTALRQALRIVDVPDPMFLSANERELLAHFRRCGRTARGHLLQAAQLLARTR